MHHKMIDSATVTHLTTSAEPSFCWFPVVQSCKNFPSCHWISALIILLTSPTLLESLVLHSLVYSKTCPRVSERIEDSFILLCLLACSKNSNSDQMRSHVHLRLSGYLFQFSIHCGGNIMKVMWHVSRPRHTTVHCSVNSPGQIRIRTSRLWKFWPLIISEPDDF